MSEGHAAPITSAERIGELDALRGFALLGVFIANYVWFGFLDWSATQANRDAFLADPDTLPVLNFVQWFVSDKANTLFAILFGIGFWVQMSRVRARGADADRIYLRRLTVLLAIGLINVFFLWPWDILTVYALAGFGLFALRRLSAKAMLAIGLVAFFLARPALKSAFDAVGLRGPAMEAAWSEAATAVRQQAVLSGDYLAWVAEMARANWFDFVVSGSLVAWLVYALGRFLIGAWVARQQWLDRIAELRPQVGRVALVALPLGIALDYVWMASDWGRIDVAEPLPKIAHVFGSLILAVGYASALLWAYHHKLLGGLVRLFAPVGRMALTAYIAHGIIFTWVLSGFGLGLAGTISPKQSLALALGVYVALSVFSHLWLAVFRYGPLEYVWRTLTYGRAPAFRRKPRLQAA